jgi:hypothetical protein
MGFGEDGFWGDPEDFMEIMYYDEEDDGTVLAEQLYDIQSTIDPLDELTVSIDESDGFPLHDFLDYNDTEIAFMLGLGETFAEENTPVKKADRHRDQVGNPIPRSKHETKKKGLAEEFLMEFSRRHPK